MARQIRRSKLEAVLAKAGFTPSERDAAHAANEGTMPDRPQVRGHGAPAPKAAQMPSI